MAKILPKYHLQKLQYSPLTMTSPYTVTHSLTNLQPIRWLMAAMLMAIFTGSNSLGWQKASNCRRA